MSEALENALRQSEAQRRHLEQEKEVLRTTAGVNANEAERLWTTLVSIGGAVLANDVDTRITSMNAVADALAGRTAADARDHRLDAVFRIVHERLARWTSARSPERCRTATSSHSRLTPC